MNRPDPLATVRTELAAVRAQVKRLRRRLEAAHDRLPEEPDADAMYAHERPKSLGCYWRSAIEGLLGDPVREMETILDRALATTEEGLIEAWREEQDEWGEITERTRDWKP